VNNKSVDVCRKINKNYIILKIEVFELGEKLFWQIKVLQSTKFGFFSLKTSLKNIFYVFCFEFVIFDYLFTIFSFDLKNTFQHCSTLSLSGRWRQVVIQQLC